MIRGSLFTLFLLCAAAPASLAQSSLPLYQKILPNGLTVVVIEDRSLPIVTVGWAQRDNPAALGDTANRLGLLNALMFTGATEDMPSAGLVEHAMRDAGIRYNLHNGDVFVLHTFQSLDYRLDAMLALVQRAVTTPVLLDDELQSAKRKADSLVRASRIGPAWHVTQQRNRILRQNGNLAFDRFGSVALIQSATTEHVQAFRRATASPANAMLIVHGPVSRFDVFNKAQQRLGEWAAYGRDLSLTPEQKQILHSTQSVVATPLAPVPTVEIYFNGPSRPDATEFATALIALEMIGGSGGLVTVKLAAANLLLDASTRNEHTGNGLSLGFAFVLAPDKFDAAYRMINASLDSFSNGGFVSEAVLKEARQSALQRMQTDAVTRHAQLESIGRWWSLGLLEAAGQWQTLVNRVTVDDVQRFMQRYLWRQPSMRVLVVSPMVQQVYRTEHTFASFEDLESLGIAFERNTDRFAGDASRLNALVQFVRINEPRRIELIVNQDAAEREGLVKRRYVALYRGLVEAGLNEHQMDALRTGLYVRRGRSAEQQRRHQITNLRYGRD